MTGWLAAAFAFLALSAAICWLLAASGGPRWPRVTLAAGVPLCALLVAYALTRPPSGEPHPGYPPAGSTFVAAAVTEPNPSQNDPGEIDLWMLQPGRQAPTAYRIRYTRQAYREILRAQRLSSRGGRVELKWRGRRSPHALVKAYREPPSRLPAKNR